MKNLLLQSLILTLDWNKSRIKCLADIIISLIESCSVNTKDLAQGITGAAKLSSKIQRVYRLFREQVFDFDSIAGFILKLFPEVKYIIALDRTCWKFGNKDINILFLVIVIGKVSVPIYWHFLDHGGACNSSLMRDMLSKFLKKFGADKISYLLADREFMNKEWLEFLLINSINFAIPLRKDMKVRIEGHLQSLAVGKSFNYLKAGEYIEVRAILWNKGVRLAAHRNDKGELMVVASNAILM